MTGSAPPEKSSSKITPLTIVLLLGLLGLVTYIVLARFVLGGEEKPKWFCADSEVVSMCIAAPSCPKEIEGWGCRIQEHAFCASPEDVAKVIRDSDAPWPCFATEEACDAAVLEANEQKDTLDIAIAARNDRPPPTTKNKPRKCSKRPPNDPDP
jgi:hypothetical protein